MKWLAAIITTILAGSICSPAQQAPFNADPSKHKLEHELRSRRWKVENGLMVSWFAQSFAQPRDTAKSEVEIFDEQGRSLAKIPVLQRIQEASSVAIYDVSVRPNQMIAVSAVCTRRAGERPADALLVFDFNGQLLSAFALAPSREVFRIELDDKSNIWTITTHSDGKNPSGIPMVVEYDTRGNILRELLTRSMFPLHAEIMKEARTIGRVSSGYDSGVFWFWLPGSTELVTIRTDDGDVSITKTGLPQGKVVPMRMVREASGTVVAEVQDYQNDGTFHRAYDVWSPAVNSWSPFNPSECGVHRLIGGYQGRLIYIRPDGSDICTSAGP
jgi:hypothetical protein